MFGGILFFLIFNENKAQNLSTPSQDHQINTIIIALKDKVDGSIPVILKIAWTKGKPTLFRGTFIFIWYKENWIQLILVGMPTLHQRDRYWIRKTDPTRDRWQVGPQFDQSTPKGGETCLKYIATFKFKDLFNLKIELSFTK